MPIAFCPSGVHSIESDARTVANERRAWREYGCRECRADAERADAERRALAQLVFDTPPAPQPTPARPHYSPARSDVRSGDVETCRVNERMDRLRGAPRPMGAS